MVQPEFRFSAAGGRIFHRVFYYAPEAKSRCCGTCACQERNDNRVVKCTADNREGIAVSVFEGLARGQETYI